MTRPNASRISPTARAKLSWVVLLAASLTVSGCFSSANGDASTGPGVDIDPNRPAATFSDVLTGPAAQPDLNATAAAAPRLVEGEWWRIEFDYGIDQSINEVVRVVANATPDGYIFGMPHEGWFKEAIAFHAPAFGDVGADLSYNTHNVRFEPVRFPLTTGATWDTAFAASPLKAVVEQADQYTATIRFDSPPNNDPTAPATNLLGLTGGAGMRIKYDARQHEVVEMESVIGKWKVTEHGYGFKGWITVPRGEHTAIDYGTFWAIGPDEPITTRKIEVAGGFNRLTMMQLLVPLSPGSFHIKSVAPGGVTFLTEANGLESSEAGLIVRFYEASDPNGMWTQEDYAVGVAATYSMGIAYHQFDIHLPDGGRRSDHDHAVVR